MSDLRDVTAKQRFEQGFTDAAGTMRVVHADYRIDGDTRAILHVEADPALRGSGAAGQFMQSLANHARREQIRLQPHCSYAVVWFKRHPEAGDVLAT
ncbi:GNAT family N-acetyltransferase [Brevundimonas variabilis]|uniref:N-acetyltransferase domain-containing protein n=1 Tax=Brevundimonas variabilis TaxID=74312 RepID=A0A7W9CKU4_9CAUL|nr:GNAT family N-acetyltransferase [Brevundimonas variabilis]MBB5747444.1 hypothetical protein [Brevundimonas variabilis]